MVQTEKLVLVTERLNIRELRESDWGTLTEIITDPAVTRFMHIDAWDTAEGRKAWFEWCLENQRSRQGGNYNWGCLLKDSGRLVGWIGIGDSDRKERPGDRSMGYMVAPAYWNQGYMSEALAEVLRYEFEVLQVPRVTANCETENVSSARVLENVGMRYLRTVYDADPLEGNLAERRHYALEKEDYERGRSPLG